MKIATTTGDFGFYCDNDIERIRELHKAGFRCVDLSMYSWKPDSVYMTDGWRDAVTALKREAEALGMQFVQAHSPGGNPLSKNPDEVEFIVAATLRSLEVCQMLGIPNTVVHPGSAQGISKEEWFEKNRAFFMRFLPTAEELGVNILTENSTDANMRGQYFANSGKDMVEFIRFVNHPRLHACWDTGHANCEGPQYDEIMALGDELYAIHYNDNHGAQDEHLMPYLGTLNHDEVIHALIDVGFQGPFTLECSSSLIKQYSWPNKRRAFEKDTRLANPQRFMQQKMIALMYDIAKFMLSAYNLFEE